jgi:hypothetical protein
VELCSHKTLFDREETHHLDHGISESLLKHVISTDAAACTPHKYISIGTKRSGETLYFCLCLLGNFPCVVFREFQKKK